MVQLSLNSVDYVVLVIYFVFVLGIGVFLRRNLRDSRDFFESGRSLPAWICALGFIGANLGAQEVMGMAASGAKYGAMTANFYWLPAVSAMVFVAVFMMPFYYGSRARSVPEYLKLRFDEKTRTFNACTFAAMTIFSSGISMYALARLLNAILGWNFHLCLFTSGAVVLAYILMGGLTSAIYNEVIQFFLIVAGFLPLVLIGLNRIGGWHALVERLKPVAVARGYEESAWMHTWAHTGSPAENPMGVEWIGLAMGLGFVLAFGYWCTDFLVVQRAMAAESMAAARRTPILAAIPKMLFPCLVILPGMIAIALHIGGLDGFVLPAKNGSLDYDMVVPAMLAHFLPNGLLGLGLTALIASFMSGMAGNVTAFNTVWTYDIYQTHVRPGADDAHYLHVGRITTAIGIFASMGAAYFAAEFNNIMDVLQLVFAFVNAPLFATFLLGMFWRRATGHGAFYGLVLGTVAAALHHGLSLPLGAMPGIKGGWMGWVIQTYTSEMAQNFRTAIFAWVVCFFVTIIISLGTVQRKTDAELQGLVYSLTPKLRADGGPLFARPAVFGAAVLMVTVIINLYFW